MQTIVIGSLNTDLVATGIKQFPKPGEHVYGKELLIGPGGKSRNIADMIARLSSSGSVAMVGKTVKDPYGLWKVPIDALHSVGVNTDFIRIADFADTQKLPGIALIPVDEQGNNQIFVLPGISDDFSPSDIDTATSLFEQVGKNRGVLVLTLECPLPTAIYAARLANKHGLKVLFDPGGIKKDSDVNELMNAGIYFIKPNEHEAKTLTGIDVVDSESAERAAAKLHEKGIENVLITAGVNGAYLFTADTRMHIPIPEVTSSGNEKDETGCGDQTMAALCAFIQQDKRMTEAANLAILAGTLQFHRTGIKPVELSELLA
ncbi:bifunctional hydroxymethylpyrimidine kinase/phosphomethylpyrimidine kinase [Candidatus Saccharibacteria bacterium]|jgi:ribokinase|nr:bifunctional hydroxymethylpyrimidine kinase/phosphomethylpyrimidine kinase [Candidatus Saccharibacteria bacterium]